MKGGVDDFNIQRTNCFTTTGTAKIKTIPTPDRMGHGRNVPIVCWTIHFDLVFRLTIKNMTFGKITVVHVGQRKIARGVVFVFVRGKNGFQSLGHFRVQPVQRVLDHKGFRWIHHNFGPIVDQNDETVIVFEHRYNVAHHGPALVVPVGPRFVAVVRFEFFLQCFSFRDRFRRQFGATSAARDATIVRWRSGGGGGVGSRTWCRMKGMAGLGIGGQQVSP